MSAPPPEIRLKRVYEAPDAQDGPRLLVERLWPRGLTRAAAAVDHWFKALAPSPELRRWFGHEPDRWPEFQKRYLDELDDADPASMDELVGLCRDRPVTFVFAARDVTRNSALVLRDHVLTRLRGD